MRVDKFDVFVPDYLGQEKDFDWQVYADEVKKIMLKCLKNVKNSESGFRDKNDY